MIHPFVHFEFLGLSQWSGVIRQRRIISRTNLITKILILDTPEDSGLLISIVKFTTS